jgi:outer membrane biosynthesis protein TonB
MAPEAEVLPAGPPAPAEPPPEAREKAAAHPSPVAAPRHEREDPNGPDPQPSIAVGQLADPIAAGATYALDLALRYPIAAAREPRLRGSLVVAYPPEALMAKKGKRVVALLTLDESGTVLETKLVPGDAVFGPAVLSALKDVQFTPADIDGRPAPYWVLLEFSFSADAAESGAMPQRPSKLRQPSVGR